LGADPDRDLLWCAADAHLSEGDRALPAFLEWLKNFEEAQVPTLVLLGDLFRVWIGLPSAQTADQEKVLERLGSLASKGRRIVYLAGNRDYFAEVAGSRAGLSVLDSWDFEAPSEPRVRFEHGHLVNSSDKRYLRWHSLTRSFPAKAAFRALPSAWQKGLARKLEERLSGTNVTYKNYEPALELERWASRLKSEGVNAAVLGHFHVDAVKEICGLPVRFVPQFREEGLHLRIATGGAQSLVPFSPSAARPLASHF
jgi:UDP-2,3-diacylglucosamine pyrophosphatase LpxH